MEYRAGVREVEVKFRVRDTESLLVALKRRGVELDNGVFQDDQAYAPADWCYGDSKGGVSFVRLRTVGGQHTFTLKRPAENALSCEEFESVVTDRQQMDAAICAMGFAPTVRIAKSRRSGKVGDVAVCVDEVEGLGGFIELERMVSDGVDGEAVQDELASWVADLGVDVERTTETYDSLVRALSA